MRFGSERLTLASSRRASRAADAGRWAGISAGAGRMKPGIARVSHARRITVLVLLLLLVPVAVHSQPAGKVPRVGILWAYSPSVVSILGDAFRQGLRGLGYVDGQNILLEERWAEGRFDRLPSLAAELSGLKLDVIVTASTPAVQAAQRATKTIPIVMTLVSDPVEDGIVASLARPGRNVTGLSLMHPELSAKRVALLKEVVPKLSRVAVLWSPSTASYRKV